MSRFALVLAVLLAVTTPCSAQTPDTLLSHGGAPSSPPSPVLPMPPDFPRGRISGTMFGDCYYNATGNPEHVYDATGADLGQAHIDSKNPITQDLNGVQLRRVYFQLDNDLSIRYSTRFRLEVDSKSLTSDGKFGVAVKAAYLQARSIVPRGDFLFGVLSTPTFQNSEDFWRYRAVEKTLVDFRGLVSSADVGLQLRGYCDRSHRVGYLAMIGNGQGQKAENNRFKRLYLSLPLRFGDLRIEPYADYQGVRVNLDKAKPVQPDSAAVNNDQATFKVFVGYEFRRWALGFEAVDRVNHLGPAANQEPRGLSVFARGTATPTLDAFARLDYWQPDRRNVNRVDSYLWIAGLDWQPFKDIHVMPNLEAMRYVAKGTTVAPSHHELQARVTFYYAFSGPRS